MNSDYKGAKKKLSFDPSDSFRNENFPYWMLVAFFLASLSLISYEIATCRILSVILSYHYVFIVVSLACLGIAAGNILIYLNPHRLKPIEQAKFLIGLSSFLMISPVLIALLSYFEKLATNLILITMLLIIPFFFFGAFVSSIFMLYKERATWLYAADLIGASAGSLVVIPMLNSFDPVNACLLLSLIALIASLIMASTFSLKKKLKRIILIISIIIVGFFSLNFFQKKFIEVQIGTNKEKQSFVVLNKKRKIGEIIETRWNIFGKTDLVKLNNFPDIMILYLDGTAGTPMVRFNGDPKKPNYLVEGLKVTTPGYFPLFFLEENQKDNALIIGPGGGRDLLLVLMAGYRKIKAVEVNRAIVEIGKKYFEFNGGIYSKFDNIEIIIGEGRNFIKKSKENFDLILIQFPYTESSRSVDNYVLTESYLFTQEAIKELYDHLTPEGQLVIACNTFMEVMRVLSTFLSLSDSFNLRQKDAMERVFILGSKEEKNLIGIKKQKINFNLALEMEIRAKELGYEIANCYFPHREEGLNRDLKNLAKENISIQQLILNFRNKKIDLRPVKDINPFFFKFETKVPRAIKIVVIVSSILAIFLAILYLFENKFFKKINSGSIFNKDWPVKKKLELFLYFSFLGIGFMLIEVSLIQKNIILFENPALSMAIILFSLLIGAGIGSYFGSKLKEANAKKLVSFFLIMIIIISIIYSQSGRFIVEILLGHPFFLKTIIIFLFVSFLAFFMGIPFPVGLKFLIPNKNKKDVAFMWATNGVNSVVGGSLAMLIAINWGFNIALIIGSICYLINFILINLVVLREKESKGQPLHIQ